MFYLSEILLLNLVFFRTFLSYVALKLPLVAYLACACNYLILNLHLKAHFQLLFYAFFFAVTLNFV